MPAVISPLRELCSPPLENLPPRKACRACQALGCLARWWLRPEVLELAQAHDASRPEWTNPERPPLPEKLGDCLVIFRTKAELPLFRPAFVMPLCWQPGSGHSRFLPPELIALAEQVVADVRQELAQSGEWGLHPADGLGLERNPVDDGLGLACQSGWAALAAGLIARAEGLLPRGRVWASGAWNRYGLADINGLEEKLQLAVEWEATEFFVPVWRVGEARDWLDRHGQGRLQIGALAAPIQPDPRLALKQYLAELTEQPQPPEADRPDEQQQFEHCRNYFLHQAAFTPAERSFYRSHLLPGIVRRCREMVRQRWPDVRATHCVTIVSPSPELALLTPLVLAVERCLLLHTADLANQAAECQERLAREGLTGVAQQLEAAGPAWADIQRKVQEFTQDVAPDKIAIDLTPGKKMMTYALSRAARPGNWLFNLDAKFLVDRRTDPGTERPELWRGGV